MIYDDLVMIGAIKLDEADNLMMTSDFCRLYKLQMKHIMRVPSLALLVTERR